MMLFLKIIVIKLRLIFNHFICFKVDMKKILLGLLFLGLIFLLVLGVVFFNLYDSRIPKDKLIDAYLGDAKVQYEVSGLYSDLNDIKKYKTWMKRSADRGYSPAIHHYAGELTDHNKAANIIKKAAHNGDYFAQIKMANSAKTTEEAREWAKKAASSGEYSKQIQAGDIYARRQPPDYKEAYYWRSIAAISYKAMGGDTNDLIRDGYKQHLTPEQIAAVDGRVKLYHPNVCHDTKGIYTCFKCSDDNGIPPC